MITKTLIKTGSLKEIRVLIEDSSTAENPYRIFAYFFPEINYVFDKLKNKFYIEYRYVFRGLLFPQNTPFSLWIFS